jgi:hypothetical protein
VIPPLTISKGVRGKDPRKGVRGVLNLYLTATTNVSTNMSTWVVSPYAIGPNILTSWKITHFNIIAVKVGLILKFLWNLDILKPFTELYIVFNF